MTNVRSSRKCSDRLNYTQWKLSLPVGSVCVQTAYKICPGKHSSKISGGVALIFVPTLKFPLHSTQLCLVGSRIISWRAALHHWPRVWQLTRSVVRSNLCSWSLFTTVAFVVLTRRLTAGWLSAQCVCHAIITNIYLWLYIESVPTACLLAICSDSVYFR